MVRMSPRLAEDAVKKMAEEKRLAEATAAAQAALVERAAAPMDAVAAAAGEEAGATREAPHSNPLAGTGEGVGGGDVVASDGTIVQGAAQRRGQLVSKMFAHGGFRGAAKISGLLPHGGSGLKVKVPKCKDFGAEGDAGDEAHAAAMKLFSVKEFGSTHVLNVTARPVHTDSVRRTITTSGQLK